MFTLFPLPPLLGGMLLRYGALTSWLSNNKLPAVELTTSEPVWRCWGLPARA